VNDDEQRRAAFVELERLLWRRVLGRLRKVTPEASVYVGFAVSEQPAQELA
jgi:outer membrane receptor for monomeric catechols